MWGLGHPTLPRLIVNSGVYDVIVSTLTGGDGVEYLVGATGVRFYHYLVMGYGRTDGRGIGRGVIGERSVDWLVGLGTCP